MKKLAFAEEQVATMQKELEDLQPQLVVASDENEKLMEGLSGKCSQQSMASTSVTYSAHS